MEKENKMMTLFLIISMVLHIILYVFLPNMYKKIEIKKEEEAITVKLIEYQKPQSQNKQIKDVKKSQEEKKVVSNKQGESPVKQEKPKLVPKGQTIITNDQLPKIEVPKIDIQVRSEERIIIDRPSNKNLTVIKKDIDNEFKGENIELIETDEKLDFVEKELFAPELKNEIKDEKIEIKINTDTDGSGKSIGDINVPSEVELQLVAGKGEVRWNEKNILPKYPSEAEKRGWQGNVVLLMQVKEDGTVLNSRIEKRSGYDILDIEAERASKFWKIHVVNNSGVKISGEVRLTLKFELKR
ncbi:MAG: energy transducer TonB [Fusobacteria bacterium]|nr:energy transducer TonB [Fusobacteriota bacterium]